MKLNLGCGDDIKDGYTNVDFRPTHPSVFITDLSKLPWPFEDESADEILMLDFLEHFPYAMTKSILLECFRILSPDGELIVQVPDGEHLTRAIGCVGEYLCNKCGGTMVGGEPSTLRPCKKCGQTPDTISEAAMRRLYGGQDYDGNFHQTCFTKSSLRDKASLVGLKLVGYEEKDHQYANWNFKARFSKGDLW